MGLSSAISVYMRPHILLAHHLVSTFAFICSATDLWGPFPRKPIFIDFLPPNGYKQMHQPSAERSESLEMHSIWRGHALARRKCAGSQIWRPNKNRLQRRRSNNGYCNNRRHTHSKKKPSSQRSDKSICVRHSVSCLCYRLLELVTQQYSVTRTFESDIIVQL